MLLSNYNDLLNQNMSNYIQQNPEDFLGNNIVPNMAYYSCNNK